MAESLAQFQAELIASVPVLTEAVRAATKQAGFMIEAQAKQTCPFDTGNLQSSIQTETRDSGTRSGVVVGPFAHYGGYVEHGTRKMAPRPDLNPAFDHTVPKYMDALKRAIGEAL